MFRLCFLSAFSRQINFSSITVALLALGHWTSEVTSTYLTSDEQILFRPKLCAQYEKNATKNMTSSQKSNVSQATREKYEKWKKGILSVSDFFHFLPVSHKIDIRTAKFLEDFMRSENYICILFESQVDSNLKKLFSVHGNTVMLVSDLRNFVRVFAEQRLLPVCRYFYNWLLLSNLASINVYTVFVERLCAYVSVSTCICVYVCCLLIFLYSFMCCGNCCE